MITKLNCLTDSFQKRRYKLYEDTEYDYGYYLIEYVNADGATEWYDTDAFTKEEAVGRFLMSHPDISYGDVVDVCVGKEAYRYC